jgi:hypothetical protein
MKTHIGPIYLILGLMAVSTLTIGAGKAPAAPVEGVAQSVHAFQLEGVAKARAFQATSPGMAMPGRFVVLVTALGEARTRRKAG